MLLSVCRRDKECINIFKAEVLSNLYFAIIMPIRQNLEILLVDRYSLISAFWHKILGRWWGPTNATCCSVNVDGVVGVLGGGGDTSTLHIITELIIEHGSKGCNGTRGVRVQGQQGVQGH